MKLDGERWRSPGTGVCGTGTYMVRRIVHNNIDPSIIKQLEDLNDLRTEGPCLLLSNQLTSSS
jgi:hypothetical protein